LGKGRAYIGTSGWHYDHWEGPFYPEGTAAGRRLAYYSQRLDTVELNNSFYQLPKRETLEQWRETTPEGFAFAVKASRYITHMKKLKDPDEPLANFLEPVSVLGDKLGPVLFQLPPNWRVNHRRLEDFLRALPEGGRYVMEFRDESWFDGRVLELLRAHNVAFCIYDIAGRGSPKEVTADFAYVRLHGPAEEAYQGSYSPRQLSGWAGALSAWLRRGRDAYCYFDNDQAGYAAQNALRLAEMLA
jgi:uncharacterized protein YecE (DUF72 family)